MKTYQIGIRRANIEEMWRFVQKNQRNIHIQYHETLTEDSTNSFQDGKIYVYRCYMYPETYTAFALSIPLITSDTGKLAGIID